MTQFYKDITDEINDRIKLNMAKNVI